MTTPPIAQTVVWRHPCDCASASRSLLPGEEPEHRFDVDGQPFPWHLEEHRPAWFRYDGSLYLVTVRIFPLARDTMEMQRTEFDEYGLPTFVHVNGDRTPFPWLLAAKPVSFTAGGRGNLPLLRLTFLAEHVDADVEIPELP